MSEEADVKHRNGGMVLLILVALLWSAFWGWTYYAASAEAEAWARIYAERHRQLVELRGGPRDTPANRAYFRGRLLEAAEFRAEQNYRRDLATRTGLGGLGVLAILVLIGAWVRRRPTDP